MNIDLNENIRIVSQFNEALNDANIEAMMELTTEGTIFENTSPSPDGERYEGKTKVRAFWEDFFRSSTSARIEIEEKFSTDTRCIMRWTYHWKNTQGGEGHIRGVDIYRIENKRIAEKLSYVKG